MSHWEKFVARGREALLSGRTTYDVPMVEGGHRWGATVILRPTGAVLDRLIALARSAGGAAGPGHWVHGGDTLHLTLRSLENYRQSIPPGDPLRTAYAAALGEAAEGLPPARVLLRGVSPHAGGVLARGHPEDDTLVSLQKRFAHALASRGLHHFESGMVRDVWYVSLLHFAAPVADPRPLAAWCDEHAGTPVGVAEMPAVELAQAVHLGAGVRLDTLERVPLTP
ncbi:hypothetical protein [Nonomuraea sp. LPB2021202275-12-8]|uniref:hypothetical protein n=1 Tax=Nonomuraea sp. LPB2021202275-12-8 TaxID=3120159 RepID=UPI00300CC118